MVQLPTMPGRQAVTTVAQYTLPSALSAAGAFALRRAGQLVATNPQIGLIALLSLAGKGVEALTVNLAGRVTKFSINKQQDKIAFVAKAATFAAALYFAPIATVAGFTGAAALAVGTGALLAADKASTYIIDFANKPAAGDSEGENKVEEQ